MYVTMKILYYFIHIILPIVYYLTFPYSNQCIALPVVCLNLIHKVSAYDYYVFLCLDLTAYQIYLTQKQKTTSELGPNVGLIHSYLLKTKLF